jgi:hypothetical protein
MESMKKVEISARIKLDCYKIINDAVEAGITIGWNRSYKHSDEPSKENIMNEIHSSIMNELFEILKFDDET